jgi:group I intron endonuclease
MDIGIYRITCTGNNKCYIGQSIYLHRRENEHLNDLKRGKHHNRFLQNSYKKYGSDSIKFEIIELCEKSQLNKREVYWIEYHNSFRDGFNSTLGGKLNYIEPKKFDFVNLKRGIEVYCSIPELVAMYPDDNLDKSYLYKTINGKTFSYRGWSYKHSIFKSQKGVKHRIPISMTNIASGETLSFISMTEAAKYIGTEVSSIILIKKGRGTHVKGWTIEGVKNKKQWKTIEIKLENIKTGEIKSFASRSEAAKYLNVDSGFITRLAQNKIQTCKGWKILGTTLENKSKKHIYAKNQGKIYFFESGNSFAKYLNVHRDTLKFFLTGKRNHYKTWSKPSEDEFQVLPIIDPAKDNHSNSSILPPNLQP